MGGSGFSRETGLEEQQATIAVPKDPTAMPGGPAPASEGFLQVCSLLQSPIFLQESQMGPSPFKKRVLAAWK